MGFIKVLTQILTGADNETHDMGRYIAILSFMTAFTLEVYSVVKLGKVFDIQAFGTGVGILMAGVGAMLKLKESTEPPAFAETVNTVTVK